MLKYLNPIFAIKILINTASEFRHWLYYCKTVNRLNKSGILTKYGLKMDYARRIYYGIDLQPEVLLYEDGPVEEFEKTFVVNSLSKLNDLFIKAGLLEIMETEVDRIYTTRQYGYIVWLKFKHIHFTLGNLFYLTIYSVVSTLLLMFFIHGMGNEWIQTALNVILSLF